MSRALCLLAVGLTAGAALVVPAVSASPVQAKDQAQAFASPLVFGHRGASGYRPEHTLAAYELAIKMGADVIEPDLVSTKDHQLVARHENDITGTTNVAEHPEFAVRRTTHTIDGSPITGWFTEDFTLAELRTLRAKERLPQVREENTLHDGRSLIPTLQEVIDLAARASKEQGRPIGIAPETKHPSYFDGLGLSLEEPLVATLKANQLDKSQAVWVQSFETGNLRELSQSLRTHLVQLTSASGRPFDDTRTYAQLTTPEGLRDIASYADVLGPEKTQILPRGADGTTSNPTPLVSNAHAAGLEVVPYTFRAENQFLPVNHRRGVDPFAYGDVLGELADMLATGVDGFFTDQPDLGVLAREEFHAAS